MSKKALKIFTASAVAASVVTPVASANTTFNDITPSNSHYEAVQSLVERGRWYFSSECYINTWSSSENSSKCFKFEYIVYNSKI